MKKAVTFLFLLFCFSIPMLSQWPRGTLVDVRDGQTYKTVVIGEQLWMAENLNIGTMINSTKPGYEMSDNQIIEKYCWDNNEDFCNGENEMMKKGGFYEWKEAVQYWDGQPQHPVQSICPEGWHIPSIDEWNTLIVTLGGIKNAIPKLLEGGSSGFDALLTGYRCTMTGSFRPSAMSADTRTYFWVGNQTDANNAPMVELGQNSLTSFSYAKSLGLCIRCIYNQLVIDVKEDVDKSGINVFPNPADEFVDVDISAFNKSAGFEIVVFNTLGESQYEKIYHDSGSLGIININTSNYPTGKYYIRLSSGNISKILPLTVIH